MEVTLSEMITKEYGLNVTSVQSLGRKSTKVFTDQGEYVVKTIPVVDRADSKIARHVAAYDFLNRQQFPALSLLAAPDGRKFIETPQHIVFLYRFLDGSHPVANKRYFKELGMLLGSLHSLPADGYRYQSDYHPSIQVPQLAATVKGARDASNQQAVSDVLRAIKPEKLLDQAPQVFIHSDPYYFNMIRDQQGVLHFIDLDSAGIAPAVIDIGFVLAQMCLVSPEQNKALYWQEKGSGARWESKRAISLTQTFMDAYRSVRPLSDVEIFLLPYAVKLATVRHIVNAENRFNWEYYSRLQHTSEYLSQALMPAVSASSPEVTVAS